MQLSSIKIKFKWTEEQDQSLQRMKEELAKQTLLMYPDFNKPFKVYTDTSSIQIRAAITQEGAPITFFSQKMTRVQINYIVIEKELLSIVETLQTYQTILLGHWIIIYSDHKNLSFKSLKLSCVLH